MSGATQPASLLRNLALFGRLLRDLGLEAGPQRLQTAARGLDAMGLQSRETVYWTLFSVFVSRREEAAAFDVAFAAFWDRLWATIEGDDHDPSVADSEASVAGDGPPAASPSMADAAHEQSAEDDDDLDTLELGVSWSAAERLRHVDFSTYESDDLAEAGALLERLRRTAPRRRSRRFRAAADGRDLDPRRTLRSAMRTEGHPVQRCWREHRLVPRRVIFLVDVSGSMEPYARPLLLFAQVVLHAARKIEVFTFGTRLTRITGELAERDAPRALSKAGQAIPDWAGGTRIGDNVKELNDTAGRRALTRGAVVVVVSDGCEQGDPDLLAREMARLRRSAHTILWVNPLAGDLRYEPRTKGMVAALPSIDMLLPGHDLAALESLAAILEAVPQRRVRRGGSA